MIFVSYKSTTAATTPIIASVSAKGNIAVNSTITLQAIILNTGSSGRTRDIGIGLPSGLINQSNLLIKNLYIAGDSFKLANFTIKITSVGDFEILFYLLSGGEISNWFIAHLLVQSPPSALPPTIIINQTINIDNTIPFHLNNTVNIHINTTIPVRINTTIRINNTLSLKINATIPVHIDNTIPVYLNNTISIHINNSIPVYATINISNSIRNLNNITTFCNTSVYNAIVNNITNKVYNQFYANVTNKIYNQFIANITNNIYNVFVANVTNHIYNSFIANITNKVYNEVIANVTNLIINKFIANFTQYTNISQIQWQWQWQHQNQTQSQTTIIDFQQFTQSLAYLGFFAIGIATITTTRNSWQTRKVVSGGGKTPKVEKTLNQRMIFGLALVGAVITELAFSCLLYPILPSTYQQNFSFGGIISYGNHIFALIIALIVYLLILGIYSYKFVIVGILIIPIELLFFNTSLALWVLIGELLIIILIVILLKYNSKRHLEEPKPKFVGRI